MLRRTLLTAMASSWDERKLVTELKAGNREAFEQLLDSCEDKVYSLVHRMVGAADAEDVAQDALIEICKAVLNFRGDSSLATWVHRVAVNVCLEHRRKRRPLCVAFEDEVGESEPDPGPDPSETVVRGELKGNVDAAIDMLPELHRDVVVLHELQGLTYAECAKALGCPVGTVKSRLSNAFVKLRELLQSCAVEGEVAI